MPQFAIEFSCSSASVPVYVYRVSEAGYVVSVVVSLSGVNREYGSCWVEVGSMLGGRGDAFVTSVFVSDWVGGNGRGVWNGRYFLEPYEELYAKVLSLVSVAGRVVGKIERGDP